MADKDQTVNAPSNEEETHPKPPIQSFKPIQNHLDHSFCDTSTLTSFTTPPQTPTVATELPAPSPPRWRFLSDAKKSSGHNSSAAGIAVAGISSDELGGKYTYVEEEEEHVDDNEQIVTGKLDVFRKIETSFQMSDSDDGDIGDIEVGSLVSGEGGSYVDVDCAVAADEESKDKAVRNGESDDISKKITFDNDTSKRRKACFLAMLLLIAVIGMSLGLVFGGGESESAGEIQSSEAMAVGEVTFVNTTSSPSPSQTIQDLITSPTPSSLAPESYSVPPSGTLYPTQSPSNSPYPTFSSFDSPYPTFPPIDDDMLVVDVISTLPPVLPPTMAPTLIPVMAPTSTPVSSPTLAPIQAPTPYPVRIPNQECPPLIQKIKIISTSGVPLQMLEVRVISNGVNIAIGKPASQSSTYVRPNGATLDASYAVDGNLGTFQHTHEQDDSAWWMVDLGAMELVESVLVANRYCSTNPGCLCRLSYATVQLLNEQDDVVAQESFGDTCREHNSEVFFASSEYCLMPTNSPVEPVTREVNCGTNYAADCVSCPIDNGADWCSGDCVWSALTKTCRDKGQVLCGGHTAESCASCGTDASFCNGDCEWNSVMGVCHERLSVVNYSPTRSPIAHPQLQGYEFIGLGSCLDLTRRTYDSYYSIFTTNEDCEESCVKNRAFRGITIETGARCNCLYENGRLHGTLYPSQPLFPLPDSYQGSSETIGGEGEIVSSTGIRGSFCYRYINEEVVTLFPVDISRTHLRSIFH